MSRYLCDTSCLVATVCKWHEHHVRTVFELERRNANRQELVLAAHSLVEAYAVLTRLPSPNRLRPRDAIELLETNWSDTPIVHLSGRDTWSTLSDARRLGIIGGQTYDALIAACALKGRAAELLTWNIRNFAPFSEQIRIVAPP